MQTTSVPERHREWVRNFVAMSHAQGTSPCRALALTSITQLAQAPFMGQVGNEEKPKKFEPVNYYESWIVDACGSAFEWRIFEDKLERYDTPTVILWQRRSSNK